METSFFLLDAFAITLLIYNSLQNEKRPPGSKMVGRFRYRETKVIKTSRPVPEWVKTQQDQT